MSWLYNRRTNVELSCVEAVFKFTCLLYGMSIYEEIHINSWLDIHLRMKLVYSTLHWQKASYALLFDLHSITAHGISTQTNIFMADFICVS